MQPIKPYLIRAYHEWISDNHLTPYVLVSATYEGVAVPNAYVEDGRIILNTSYSATRDLVITNEELSFKARFNGVVHIIRVPLAAVLAVYAKENGQGIFIDEDVDDASDQALSQDSEESKNQASEEPKAKATVTALKKKKGSHLSIVK